MCKSLVIQAEKPGKETKPVVNIKVLQESA
jgi:hypothetical protein